MYRFCLSAATMLAALFLGSGCRDENCGDHEDGSFWCDGSTVVQCVQGGTMIHKRCAPETCVARSAKTASCVLTGAVCPTANLGYQCLGEHRVICLANGLVTDEGACSPQTPSQRRDWVGPYCVENPGGAVLSCGWKKDKCSNEGQMTCFDDGSAMCAGGVYVYFVPNNKGREATCSPTPLANCWIGKTWCEGDVLKRCDNCLGSEACGSITVEAICGAGECVPYPRPPWMGTSVDEVLYGCAADSTACRGRQGMVCVNDAMATCVDGKAVVGLTCSELQLLWGLGPSSGPTRFGPFCVERASAGDAICALDPSPCDVENATRCAPEDASGTLLDTCQKGVWLRRDTCIDPSAGTTVCRPTEAGATCN